MSFVNNPNGLESAIRTPEIRATEEVANKKFGNLVAKMHKAGYSFDGEEYFIDADGNRMFDKFGVRASGNPSKRVREVVPPKSTTEIKEINVTPPKTIQGFIPPPTQVVQAITVEAIVHQFKVYDPVQQQILLTILNQ